MTTQTQALDASEVVACTDVVLALYEAIDGKYASEASSLFCEDAAFDHPERPYHGREEIAAFLLEHEQDAGRHTLHILDNTRVKARPDGERDVCSVVFVHGRAPDGEWHLRAIARMRHTVRPEDGQWRIAARVIEPLERR